MKINYSFNTLAFLLSLAVIALVVSLGNVGQRYLQDRQSHESILSEKNATIEYYRTQTGRLVAEKNAAVLRSRDLEKAYPEIYKALKTDFDIKTKDLKAYIRSEIQATGSGTADIINNDYHYGVKQGAQLRVNDNYLKLEATVLDSLHASYSYTYSDTIQQAISIRKKWFLGRETLYGSAMLSNPSAKVVGSTNISIDNYRDKRFGLGVGVFYDPFTNSPRVGIGVTYNLIKF
jgi:hypothetical protein